MFHHGPNEKIFFLTRAGYDKLGWQAKPAGSTDRQRQRRSPARLPKAKRPSSEF
jgi:hypothetical protein